MTANELTECVNLTEIMDLKLKHYIRDFSHGTYTDKSVNCGVIFPIQYTGTET